MANLRFIYRIDCFAGGDEWTEGINVRTFDTPQESRVWSYGDQTFRLGALAAIVDRDLEDPLIDKLYYDGWFTDLYSCPDSFIGSHDSIPFHTQLQNAVSRLSELGFVELAMKVLNRLHELFPAVQGGVKYAL